MDFGTGSRLMELVQFIRPDGQVINLNSPPTRGIRNMSGWGRPAMTTASIKSPYQHGENLLSYRLNPRTITLDLYYKGGCRTDWFNERTKLVNQLGMNATNPNNPETGILRREYLQDNVYKVRELVCYLSDGLGFDNSRQWHNFGIVEPLTFIAPDPIIYDPTLVTVTVDTFTEELILPVTFPFLLGTEVADEGIIYAGTWPTFPIIEIDGYTTGVTITNTTTNKSLKLDYFIGTGRTVTIDTTYGNKSVTDDLGNNLISYLIDSDLNQFEIVHDPLVTNGVNSFIFQLENTNASTEIRIKYYTRYYGI